MNLEKYAQSLYYILAVNNHLSLIYGDYEIVWLSEWELLELRQGSNQKQLSGSTPELQGVMEEIAPLQDWQIKDSRL